MKTFWSNKIKDMVPYVPGEQPKNRTFIKLNTNENPYPPSPLAIEAMKETVGEGLRLYPDPDTTALCQELANMLGIDSSYIFCGNGSDEVLAFAFQAFFDTDKVIAFPDITYGFYPVYAEFFGMTYREIPLTEEFAIRPEDYIGDFGGIIFPNPNAPTGRELSLFSITTILEGNPNCVVIVDEAYVDFGGSTAVELLSQYENLLIIRTLSKSRALAGLRVGFALGHPNLIAGLNCVKNSFNSYAVDSVAIAGGSAALADRGYFAAITGKIIMTREMTANRLIGMGFSVCPSTANFLFVTHPQKSAKELLDGLREEGILVRWWNKPRIENHLRITIGTKEEMITLCETLEKLLV